MSLPPVALVTAGSAGLGAATAKAFAIAGYKVVINYSNNSSRASALLSELETLSPLPKPSLTATVSSSPNFLTIQADLSRQSEISRLVSLAVTEMGRLDVVFSNGGWTSITDFHDLDDNVDEEMWDRCWNINVKSHLWIMRAARKYLEESEGCFVTTASLAGVRPSGSSVVSRSTLAFNSSVCLNETALFWEESNYI